MCIYFGLFVSTRKKRAQKIEIDFSQCVWFKTTYLFLLLSLYSSHFIKVKSHRENYLWPYQKNRLFFSQNIYLYQKCIFRGECVLFIFFVSLSLSLSLDTQHTKKKSTKQHSKKHTLFKTLNKTGGKTLYSTGWCVQKKKKISLSSLSDLSRTKSLLSL